jgi:hypothetical protein
MRRLPVLALCKAALAAVAFVALAGSSIAQPTACPGVGAATIFGNGCVWQGELPAITNSDYGVVRFQYRPAPVGTMLASHGDAAVFGSRTEHVVPALA